MATKTLCDVCGKEIDFAAGVVRNTFYIGTLGVYRRLEDVCQGCTAKINEFVTALQEKASTE